MFKKRLAIALITGVIACQALASIPPTWGLWYWPFIDYPMYADSHRAGDTFSFRELRVVPCSNPGASRTLAGKDLHIPWMQFGYLLEGLSRARTNGSAEDERGRAHLAFLATVVRRMEGDRWCAAQIWSRTFTLGSRGVVDESPPWELTWERPLPPRP